jgi:hypothetical protein
MKLLLRFMLTACVASGSSAWACAQGTTEDVREKIRLLMQEAQELAKLGDDEEAHRVRTKIAEMLEEQRRAPAPLPPTSIERGNNPREAGFPDESMRGYQGPHDRNPNAPMPPFRRPGWEGISIPAPDAPMRGVNRPSHPPVPRAHQGSNLDMALEHIRMAEHHFQESGMRELAERMRLQGDEIRTRLHAAREETPRRDAPMMVPRDDQQWIRQSLQELREENRRLREMVQELMERTSDRNR